MAEPTAEPSGRTADEPSGEPQSGEPQSGGAMPCEAPPGDASLTLHQAASRHGAYRWTEQRLFELTGAWSAGPGLLPALRVLLFEASAQHASHAASWYDRLPILATVDRDALTRPVGPLLGPLMAQLATGAPGGGAEPVGGAVGAAGDADAGLRFVAGLYRVVLPRLLDSYRRHAARLSPVADEPSLHTVADIVRAEETELAAANALLDEVGALDATGALVEGAIEALGGSSVGTGTAAEDLVPWSDGHCAW